ncbi:hypothetical protein D3OALGB2SA_1605 [Olavius algarvensis associated proteobacterium Delta 3]|nr:hypothetical protein D3OALGB2SA_1605 [Olavius algarvensis associated proteobacterium Delta 3]
MSDIVRFWQFQKIDGKTVKVPAGLDYVLKKHTADFHLIHKEIKNAIKLLNGIFDDSRKVCAKEGIQLQPKRVWVETVLKDLIAHLLDEDEIKQG